MVVIQLFPTEQLFKGIHHSAGPETRLRYRMGKCALKILSKVLKSRKKLQLTVLLSGGSKVESSHTVKLYVLFPHLATRLSSEKRRKVLKERHIARKLTVQTDPAEVLGGWVWNNLS